MKKNVQGCQDTFATTQFIFLSSVYVFTSVILIMAFKSIWTISLVIFQVLNPVSNENNWKIVYHWLSCTVIYLGVGDLWLRISLGWIEVGHDLLFRSWLQDTTSLCVTVPTDFLTFRSDFKFRRIPTMKFICTWIKSFRFLAISFSL